MGFPDAVFVRRNVAPVVDEVEEWRTVVEFPNYEVSSLGRVRNARTKHVLKPQLGGKDGCNFCVCLSKNPRTSRPIHRLVLEAFVGPAPPGLVGKAIDGNKFNTRLSNLKWGKRDVVRREANDL